MNAYIMPDGTISLTDLSFNQAKMIQTAVRRLLDIDKRLQLDTHDNNRALMLIDDVCNHFPKRHQITQK